MADERILLVEIGQHVGEPALGDIAALFRGRVGIEDRLKPVAGNAMVGAGSVEPVRRGRVGGPRMHSAHVIGYGIEDHLHAAVMQSVRQTGAGRPCEPKCGSVLVEVGRAVAVVSLGAAIVVVYRRGPEGGDAELLEIVEMLFDPAKIAAMPATGRSRSDGWGSLDGSPSAKRSVMMRYITSDAENPAWGAGMRGSRRNGAVVDPDADVVVRLRMGCGAAPRVASQRKA